LNNQIIPNEELQKRWSPEAYGENSSCNSHKLQQGKFLLDVRVWLSWNGYNRLPRKTV